MTAEQGQGKPCSRWKFEKAIARSLLPPHLRATAMRMCSYADFDTGANCFPGYERLAKDMGMSSRQVRRNITELRRRGWLYQVWSGRGNQHLAAIWQLCKAQGDTKGTPKGHSQRDTHDPPPTTYDSDSAVAPSSSFHVGDEFYFELEDKHLVLKEKVSSDEPKHRGWWMSVDNKQRWEWVTLENLTQFVERGHFERVG